MVKTNAAARLRASSGITATKKSATAKNKTVARTRVHAIELPKFRYIDDVTRFLDTMKEEIDENEKVIKVHQTQLAFLKKPKEWVGATLVKAAEMELTIKEGEGGSNKSRLKRKIDPELTKVVVPNVKKLEEQYSLSEDLYEKHRTLEAVEAQLSMQFPDRRGEAYTATIAALHELKGKVAKQLKTVLGFLNEVAAKHVPKTFEKYIDVIRQEVQEHVMFEDSNLFLYVSTSAEGQIVFTYYLMLINATNDEGKVTPSLYISVQWVVGESTTIQINPEYELPGQLLKEGGESVGSAGEAVKAISDLLALEDFSSSLGTVPLSTQLRKPLNELKPEMFSYKDFIQKLDVDEDKLVFKLRKGVEPEQAKEVAYALYQEVKGLFKSSRTAKIRMKPSSTQIEFTVTNVAKGREVSVHDAEFLGQKFGLNNAQLRKVLLILNSGIGEESKPSEAPETKAEQPTGKEKLWL
jgi:hypothetical protein